VAVSSGESDLVHERRSGLIALLHRHGLEYQKAPSFRAMFTALIALKRCVQIADNFRVMDRKDFRARPESDMVQGAVVLF
jgi:hypothetical protein